MCIHCILYSVYYIHWVNCTLNLWLHLTRYSSTNKSHHIISHYICLKAVRFLKTTNITHVKYSRLKMSHFFNDWIDLIKKRIKHLSFCSVGKLSFCFGIKIKPKKLNFFLVQWLIAINHSPTAAFQSNIEPKYTLVVIIITTRFYSDLILPNYN